MADHQPSNTIEMAEAQDPPQPESVQDISASDDQQPQNAEIVALDGTIMNAETEEMQRDTSMTEADVCLPS